MEIIHDPARFQKLAHEKRAKGLRTGLVPTMGALHAGHYRLMETARGQVDFLMTTLFVNPRQFPPGTDYEVYPRTWDEDVAGCEARGVDVLFAPANEAMYPPGFRTRVVVDGLSEPLCGAWRPGHFEGVTTVVSMLLTLAWPTVAVFGWKDAQQLIVLRRMVADLMIPTELIGVETVREADGLAMSSRNKYLNADERRDAALISRGLFAARAAFEGGEFDGAVLEAIVRNSIAESPRFDLQYAELRSMQTLERLAQAEAGNSLLAAAAKIGGARLIDNVRF